MFCVKYNMQFQKSVSYFKRFKFYNDLQYSIQSRYLVQDLAMAFHWDLEYTADHLNCRLALSTSNYAVGR
jgi:hypothetical protein